MLKDGNYNEGDLTHYKDLVSKYGADFQALSYSSVEKQNAWHRGVVDCLLGIQCKSVLDVGCGLGDFYKRIQGSLFLDKYVGIDIIPEFIEKCVAQYGQSEKCLWRQGTVFEETEEFDLTLAIGTFCHLIPGKQDEAIKIFERSVKKMWSLCKKACVVTMITDNVKDKPEDRLALEPGHLFYLADLVGTEKVVLHRRYVPYMAVLALYK